MSVHRNGGCQLSRRGMLQTALGGALAPWALAAAGAPARRTESLNGTWSLSYGPWQKSGAKAPAAGWPTIKATVPGNVELDLIAAGKLPALEQGNRIYEAQKLEQTEWWYKRRFTAPKLAAGETAELVFEGLDCIAHVWVNGILVGEPRNMLIAHRLDVTRALRAGVENELVVRIEPAVEVGRQMQHTAGEFAFQGCWESLGVRKAPHMYGWDIIPRLVSAGLWRDVHLDVVRPAHWNSIYWTTVKVDRKNGRAMLRMDWDFTAPNTSTALCEVDVTLSLDGRTAYHSRRQSLSTHGLAEIEIENAELWWPRGYGAQPLYDATVALRDAKGNTLDEHHAQIGIRRVELRRTDTVTEQAPGEFCFVVNGEPIFVKGTNWTPMDSLHSRDVAHLGRVFPMLEELNVNMIRSWGGGVYESDELFDRCDRAGILVWQDFAFACAIYPQTPEFFAQAEAEVAAVVMRLRNHASLALWAGNNEVDDAYYWHHSGLDPNVHDKLSREVLPAVTRRLDPHRVYLPSSPFHGPGLANPSGMTEAHLWGPRGYFKEPFYTQSKAHFVSEIGYHGCPSRSSLERMMDKDFVQPWTSGHEWNDQWLTKSVRLHATVTNTRGRNDYMPKQIRAFFGDVPEKLDDFILASQAVQAEAMKFFMEYWRAGKPYRRGMIWWNLRDGWPVISDAVVDYYNARKLAFHYLLRSQRDVQAICGEETGGVHPLIVVNDTLKPARGKLRVHRAGEQAALAEVSFDVAPNGKQTCGSIPHPAAAEMWALDWTLDGGASFSTHYLATRSTVTLKQYRAWMDALGLTRLFQA